MWSATILAGLPGEGPWPEQFTHGDALTHSEGLVIRFEPPGGSEWVGNFQPGISSVSEVLVHPDRLHAIVIARGQAYVVSVGSRQLVSTFGGDITAVLRVPGDSTIIFALSGVRFEALGPDGILWKTSRISWDGFQNLRFAAGALVGEAWSAIEQEWYPFRVDLANGNHGCEMPVPAPS